jgi:predicted amidophosphoribosyltransferase
MAFSRSMEIKTMKKMIMMYCRAMHGSNSSLCPECSKLADYAEKRIDKCVYGDNKPVCSKCSVHCYKPDRKEEIKKVMRYSGPRMLLNSPILSIRYLYRKKFKSNP